MRSLQRSSGPMEFSSYRTQRFVVTTKMSWIKSLTLGYKTIETTEVEVTTMNGHSAKAFQYLGRKLR
jgi:hypothetical protein